MTSFFGGGVGWWWWGGGGGSVEWVEGWRVFNYLCQHFAPPPRVLLEFLGISKEKKRRYYIFTIFVGQAASSFCSHFRTNNYGRYPVLTKFVEFAVIFNETDEMEVGFVLPCRSLKAGK